jgi:serine/threonine protein kinase
MVYLGFIGTHVRNLCSIFHRWLYSWSNIRSLYVWPWSQEIAVKKMKPSKSKEFFAELKVLCKVHHINVVCASNLKGNEHPFWLDACKLRIEYFKHVQFHIQVELIGYAAGEDHLYLVYEYVQNGSLSEHLHDPMLKGTRKRIFIHVYICFLISRKKWYALYFLKAWMNCEILTSDRLNIALG